MDGEVGLEFFRLGEIALVDRFIVVKDQKHNYRCDYMRMIIRPILEKRSTHINILLRFDWKSYNKTDDQVKKLVLNSIIPLQPLMHFCHTDEKSSTTAHLKRGKHRMGTFPAHSTPNQSL